MIIRLWQGGHMAVRDWSAMRELSERLPVEHTGADVVQWNARVAADPPADEPALRAWLAERGVTGYPQMLLVMARFGFPDFLTAGAGELIDGRYADRPALRPVLDALLAAVSPWPRPRTSTPRSSAT
jgi:hypothetical protein